jgi:hypothetical protein
MAMGGYDEREIKPMPGPGNYSVKSSLNLGRGFAFSTADRLKYGKAEKKPGPGEYPIPGTLGGASVSMAASVQGEGSAAKVPGPGHYVPNYSQLECNPRKVPFTEAGWGKQKDPKVPGPGKYELPSTLNGNIMMKNSRRATFNNFSTTEHKSITPGPMRQATTFTIP